MEASTRASSPRSAFHAPSQMSQRHARSSTSASASIHWMAWRWLSGAPKVERCLAWATAMRCAAVATPRLQAEYGKRFLTSRSKARSRPWPSWPMRFSAGISQSSKLTSLGIAEVRITRMGLAVKPGVPCSRMKQEMPAAALALVGAREHDAPRRVVRARDEDLPPVEHPLVAAALRAGLDRAGGIGAARRLGDREERLVALAQRGHRVLLDLRLGAGPDRGRRVAAEDAAARDCRGPCGAATSPRAPRTC